GTLDVGSDTGSGRIIVDRTGLGAPTLWTVDTSVDIGPASTAGSNFGQLKVPILGAPEPSGHRDLS
ncbi:MAG: hypothetical protein JW829_06740, partial [Pirellulales bacterium]|nr:hypothetical protein [Pirellulales bacterium]